jgi:hypothetical protein
VSSCWQGRGVMGDGVIAPYGRGDGVIGSALSSPHHPITRLPDHLIALVRHLSRRGLTVLTGDIDVDVGASRPGVPPSLQTAGHSMRRADAWHA